MRLDVFLACVGIGPLGWLLSLRRTPWPGAWFVGALVASLWSLSAFVWPHVSAAGDAAATGLPIAAVVLFCVGMTEGFATQPDDVVYKFRHRRLSAGKPGEWQVITQATKLDSGKETVWVGVRANDKTRWIGEADPVSEMDAFMDLRVRAEQAKETLIALKVRV